MTIPYAETTLSPDRLREQVERWMKGHNLTARDIDGATDVSYQTVYRALDPDGSDLTLNRLMLELVAQFGEDVVAPLWDDPEVFNPWAEPLCLLAGAIRERTDYRPRG
jgi:hypothetical protein